MNKKLLLLHGALGTKSQFKKLKEKLSTHFDVYDLDFEGHSKEESGEDFTMNLFVKNVVDFLAENEIPKTNIFGYSMGGYVGLNLARTSPELVEKIITLGTKFDWTVETAAKEIKMLNPEKIEEKVPAFASKLAALYGENNWKAVVRKTAKMMEGLGAGKSLKADELKEINHSVLIGIGSEDRMVGVEESKESANILPKGSLKIIEGFQHPIEKVDTDELASIIVDFLR